MLEPSFPDVQSFLNNYFIKKISFVCKSFKARNFYIWRLLQSLSTYRVKISTLIRLTSERPCQDREGAQGATPIYLGSGANFCYKIMFPQMLASIPTHLAPFQNLFFENHKKIGNNWKSIKKLLKMSGNSKICNF